MDGGDNPAVPRRRAERGCRTIYRQREVIEVVPIGPRETIY
jgi:hypothetical protein